MKYLPGVLFVWLAIAVVLSTSYAHAQTLRPDRAESGSVDVGATVGRFTAEIDGYQSPNASVVLQNTVNLFLSSTTADDAGYFTFSEIRMTEDFPGFCFSAVDFRRVGLSESCLLTPEEITEDQTYNDIFLPPTIGLSKRLIRAGEDALIFGYSMPLAKVTLRFDEETITLQADDAGYYEHTFDDVPAGTYVFSSRAVLGEATSLEPTNTAVLEAVTLPELIRQDITDFGEDLERRFPGILILAPLLALLVALLIALLWKTKKKWFMAFFDRFRKKYPMHHDYFLFEQ